MNCLRTISNSPTYEPASPNLEERVIFFILEIALVVIGALALSQGAYALGGCFIGFAVFTFVAMVCKEKSAVMQVPTAQDGDQESLIIDTKDCPHFHSNTLVQTTRKIIGVSKDIKCLAPTLVSRVGRASNYAEEINTDDREAEGLVVLIHGLNGHPSIFDPYYDSFTSEGFGHRVTVYQPRVKDRGQCSLEDAVEPFLTQIHAWAFYYPNKPICIIGVSNGARIAAKVACELKVENPLHVSCIAGPLYGTKIVDQPDLPQKIQSVWNRYMENRHHEAIQEELAWQSETSEILINEIKEHSKDIPFDFYATYGDTIILPFNSALPVVTNGRHFTVTSEGHNSIVRAVKEPILRHVNDFIKNYLKKVED